MTMYADPHEDNFRRLATPRVNRVLEALRVVGNLANPANYSYTDTDRERIFREIRSKVDETEALFTARRKRNFKL